ncbi:membrane protein insertion efficiency factor YidD [Amycolatopsis sp. lyj-23]|uniref:membrane protein insertion efficiency factor YidD n=1 Tax=Amycolatopsis sp. lyj-23 TaxID=2789283 RepID=UPI0039784117
MVLSLPHLLVASGPILRRGTGRRSVADVLVAAVRVYQREVSARRPPCCRFSPSCSAYAVEALTRHGAVRGGGLTVRRLIRCRPGGPRGHDPVPR